MWIKALIDEMNSFQDWLKHAADIPHPFVSKIWSVYPLESSSQLPLMEMFYPAIVRNISCLPHSGFFIYDCNPQKETYEYARPNHVGSVPNKFCKDAETWNSAINTKNTKWFQTEWKGTWI